MYNYQQAAKFLRLVYIKLNKEQVEHEDNEDYLDEVDRISTSGFIKQLAEAIGCKDQKALKEALDGIRVYKNSKRWARYDAWYNFEMYVENVINATTCLKA